MPSSSPRVAPEFKIKVKKALLSNNYRTHQELADELHINRHIIENFVNGKAVNNGDFYEICHRLDLTVEEIAYFEEDITPSIDINKLVKEVRQKCFAKIEQRCAKFRSLTITKPVQLSTLYVEGRCIDKNNEYESDEQVCDLNTETLKNNLTTHKHLLVQGALGAGKTMFLRWVAFQCNQGIILEDYVPVLFTLKRFADEREKPTLLEFITKEFEDCGVAEKEVLELLKAGQLLILLDGLDELQENEKSKICENLESFVDSFSKNYFILTSRNTGDQYKFENFAEIELANFNDSKIQEFVKKWLEARKKLTGDQLQDKVDEFIKYLNVEENLPLKEIATNPLLLTLLCLIFEVNGIEELSNNRLAIYEKAVSILLNEWDNEKGVAYKNLSIDDKEELLSLIALNNLNTGLRFFRWEQLKQNISEYFEKLSITKKNLPAFVDGKAILKSIESQHGILIERVLNQYCFAHSMFQTYFAAKAIYANNTKWEQQISNLGKKSWRETFLLATKMMTETNASNLLQLVKQKYPTSLIQSEIRSEEITQFVSDLDKIVQRQRDELKKQQI